ncbi:MAG: serine protease AprX [Cryptosporangiaceae bacterium]|nr:serine protease AprX [Cryptosporangiaceae bacterium]
MRAGLGIGDSATGTRRLGAVVATAALAALTSAAVTATVPGSGAHGASVPVIVEFGGSGLSQVAADITRLGGTVGRPLALIGGVAATIPKAALGALGSAPGVRAVTTDSSLTLMASGWNAKDDSNSMYGVTTSIGAREAWKKKDTAGKFIDGTGVGVALIDSGIAPVQGLNSPQRIVNGPDLSFESQAPSLAHLDTFGHGTHMAGIILGNDPDAATDDPAHFRGVAPGASLINVKVASADGAIDVSQVIAAIDWVVQHRADPGLNIRVLNLSFGTDSNQDPLLDPLSHAVEAAWKSGIVVVVSAGNEGQTSTRLTMPAVNPDIIAVGAADSLGTQDRKDDQVTGFSNRGSLLRQPDLVAPGRSIVSLRVPGSYIDSRYPTGLVPGDTSGRYFRGSGTSQATAVVSGAAALLIQQRPTLNPDQVKALLAGSATPLRNTDRSLDGNGQLDVKKALAAPTPLALTAHFPTLGTGSLEASRGSSHVADSVDGTELTGEKDIMGRPWNGLTWGPAALGGRTWSGGTWNGAIWGGSTWTGSSWAGRTWSGVTWSGNTWSGRTWSGRTWSGAVWDGRTWSGRTWSGRTWSGTTWTGTTWTDTRWADSIWR